MISFAPKGGFEEKETLLNKRQNRNGIYINTDLNMECKGKIIFNNKEDISGGSR
jgi:hypothetical protein